MMNSLNLGKKTNIQPYTKDFRLKIMSNKGYSMEDQMKLHGLVNKI